jgi:hypothetical protein
MFSFSRNAFIVVDSDAIEKDGIVLDQSKFANAKSFIKEQFEMLVGRGYKLGLWFEEDNTEVRTLEDYLDQETIGRNPRNKSQTKKIHAQMVTISWTEGKKLSDFPHGLEPKIAELVNIIQSWNE